MKRFRASKFAINVESTSNSLYLHNKLGEFFFDHVGGVESRSAFRGSGKSIQRGVDVLSRRNSLPHKDTFGSSP